jgi:hypothetical protein
MSKRRDITLCPKFDRAIWLAFMQELKKHEDYWTEQLSQPRLTPISKALYRAARERWGGAREQLEELMKRV